MSIPLDRLYHYIEDVAKKVYGDSIIYRFYPHGSKKLEDLTPTRDSSWLHQQILPQVVCNDQEPLDFDHFNTAPTELNAWQKLLKDHDCFETSLGQPNIFDKNILLHSEQRSQEIEKYSDKFIPVYYWSHAVIALDWFRFANHIQQQKSVKHTFLIYNRAWAGSREYRLKFLDLLISADLCSQCQATVSPVDDLEKKHYSEYNFKNHQWIPINQLEKFFPVVQVPSYYSADFDLQDYESTEIEVVLETLFDDQRLHLTEKILRPIACGQPFVLAATAGSLKYLRDYGFKTFDTVWNEDYDLISDPCQRLQAIITLMKDIAAWDPITRNEKLKKAQHIADYNKKHFFSEKFFLKITTELRDNLAHGFKTLMDINTSQLYIERRKKLACFPEIKSVLAGQKTNPVINDKTCDLVWGDTMSRSATMKVLHHARQYNKKQKI